MAAASFVSNFAICGCMKSTLGINALTGISFDIEFGWRGLISFPHKNIRPDTQARIEDNGTPSIKKVAMAATGSIILLCCDGNNVTVTMTDKLTEIILLP